MSKYTFFIIKRILSFTTFCLIIILITLEIRDRSLDGKLNNLKIYQVDTVKVPTPQPSIIKP